MRQIMFWLHKIVRIPEGFLRLPTLQEDISVAKNCYNIRDGLINVGEWLLLVMYVLMRSITIKYGDNG